MVGVHHVVPFKPELTKRVGENAQGRIEDEHPENARYGRSDRVGNDEKGLVGVAAAQNTVGADRKEKRDRQADACDEHRKEHRDLEALDVVGVGPKGLEVGKPDEFVAEPEGVLHHDALLDRLPRGEEEEYERDEELRRNEHVGKPSVLEDDSFFHVVSRKGLRKTQRIPRPPHGDRRMATIGPKRQRVTRSKRASCSLPRRMTAAMASLAEA